jgi:hypothetical protein
MKEKTMTEEVKKYKVVLTIPAGRKRYLDVLLPYILREYDLLDEIRLWVNTKNFDDIIWMVEKSLKYDKIKLDRTVVENPTPNIPDQNLELYRFWNNCKDEDTLYLRLDDDVVWLEENFFKKMIDFRINNPEPLFIYPNIVNNTITDHIHQRLGCFRDLGKLKYECVDPVGVMDGVHAGQRHSTFINDINNKDIEKYKFDKWLLFNYERVSINSLAWFGRDIKDIVFEKDEEHFVSCKAPELVSKPNMIYGGVMAVHFSFHMQRTHLDSTGILELYSALSTKVKKDK